MIHLDYEYKKRWDEISVGELFMIKDELCMCISEKDSKDRRVLFVQTGKITKYHNASYYQIGGHRMVGVGHIRVYPNNDETMLISEMDMGITLSIFTQDYMKVGYAEEDKNDKSYIVNLKTGIVACSDDIPIINSEKFETTQIWWDLHN